jgi:cytochrome P450
VNDPLLRAANRRPETWPDPQRFDPDRHFDPDGQSSRTLLPFALGPRGCIGQHLAMAEKIMVLPLLAHDGDIRIDDAITEDASFALRVAGGLDGRFVPPVRRALAISPRPAVPEG